ncbi:MAG: hypothetical protein M3Y22_15515 [Pseudomonadota bacterium]|nr:hypothetical protein [Pseudomonadota bacterium]
MSISAINGISSVAQPKDDDQTVTPAPAVTPFSQQLDAQGAQAGAVHGHHHHPHSAGSQSVTTSVASAASAAGSTPAGSVVSSLLKMLS